MPATQFNADISQPGSGVSIKTSGPNQVVISSEELYQDMGNGTRFRYFERRGWLTVETIVLNTGNGMMTYHILQGPPDKTD